VEDTVEDAEGAAAIEGGRQWYLYVLYCSDDSLYTGVTIDIDRRVRAHNSGKGAKYTRSRRPVHLAACVKVGEKGRALSLEYRFKQLSRSKKIDHVATNLEYFLEDNSPRVNSENDSVDHCGDHEHF